MIQIKLGIQVNNDTNLTRMNWVRIINVFLGKLCHLIFFLCVQLMLLLLQGFASEPKNSKRKRNVKWDYRVQDNCSENA